ncbi:MAG: glycosyltransferase [Planctomycetota bacterium]
MAPRARVVVATYEQLPLLRRALRGYLRQTTNDFSLVVADDGSGAETRAFLQAFAREAAARDIPFEHVWHEDDGFRKTLILNEAVRRGKGEELLLFSDGDCIPPARFVEAHLAVHEPHSFHVGGAVRLDEETSARLTEEDVDAGRFETLITDRDRADLRRRARKSRWGTLLRRKNRPKVLGLNMAFDLGLFESLNGFDELFVGYGYEDSDLRDRAMRHRPRPRVEVLYGTMDVFHLWHPRRAGGREPNRAYYALRRPVRCERGLDVKS